MKIRNCAWLPNPQGEAAKVIWARGAVLAKSCPKSLITAESIRFLEMHRVWKSFGKGWPGAMEARAADAIELIERAWTEEYERTKQE